jgi:hypothetical protein
MSVYRHFSNLQQLKSNAEFLTQCERVTVNQTAAALLTWWRQSETKTLARLLPNLTSSVFNKLKIQGWNLICGRFCIVTDSMVSQLQIFLSRQLTTGCKQKHLTCLGVFEHGNETKHWRMWEINACRKCARKRLISLMLVKTVHMWLQCNDVLSALKFQMKLLKCVWRPQLSDRVFISCTNDDIRTWKTNHSDFYCMCTGINI